MKHTEIKLEDDEDEPELSEGGGVCSFWSGLMLGSNVSQDSRHQVSRDSQMWLDIRYLDGIWLSRTC